MPRIINILSPHALAMVSISTLQELLLQLTKERDQNSTSKTKLDSLLTSALNTGTPLSLSTLLAGTSTADSAEAGIGEWVREAQQSGGGSVVLKDRVELW